MRVFKIVIVAALLTQCVLAAAADESADAAREGRMNDALNSYRSQSSGSQPAGFAERAEDSAKRGLSRTGHAIRHGAKKVGSVVKQGAHKVGETIETGVHKTGSAIEHVGQKIEGKDKTSP